MAVDVGDGAVRRAAEVRRAHVPPGGRAQGPGLRGRARSARCRRRSRPTPSGCSRCSRTCCPTRSSSPSAGSVSLTADARHRRLEPGTGAAQRRQRRGGLLRHRHRHRHPQGQAGVIFEAFQQADAAPAASTAAPAWACRSAARSPACSAARSGSRARRARAARSRSTCRSIYPLAAGRSRRPSRVASSPSRASWPSRPSR